MKKIFTLLALTVTFSMNAQIWYSATNNSGSGASAIGQSTTASGYNSTAMGRSTTASDYGSLVIGQYNFSGSSVTNSATFFNIENNIQLKFSDSRVLPSLIVAAFLGISNACIVLTSSLFVNDVILKSSEDLYFFVSIGFAIVALSGLITQLLIVDKFLIDPKKLVFVGLLICLLYTSDAADE